MDMLFLLRQRINESLFDDTRKDKGEFFARNIGLYPDFPISKVVIE